MLHEYYDEARVARLTERLRQDGILRNPPVVAPLSSDGGDGFVVLDGANRVSALRRLEVPHVLVQMVDYAGMRLETWNHLLMEIPGEALRRLLAGEGLSAESLSGEEAEAALAQRAILAYLDLPDGRWGVPLAGDGPQRALARFVEAYQQRVRFHRVKEARLEELRQLYPEGTALVVFPRYRPQEIMAFASNSVRLPTGITRHVIPGRALRVNLSLDVLASDQTAEEKNGWLRQWLTEKLERHEVRFYEESSYLFDE